MGISLTGIRPLKTFGVRMSDAQVYGGEVERAFARNKKVEALLVVRTKRFSLSLWSLRMKPSELATHQHALLASSATEM